MTVVFLLPTIIYIERFENLTGMMLQGCEGRPVCLVNVCMINQPHIKVFRLDLCL